MNLYSLHNKPELLKHYDDAYDKIPILAWNSYSNYSDIATRREMSSKESLWAKDAKTAYMYAFNVLNDEFPLGEPAIASDARYAFRYALNLLGEPFPLGEPAIANSAEYSLRYAREILQKRWPDTEIGKKAEAAIATYAVRTYRYEQEFNLKLIDGKFVSRYPAD